MLDFDFYSPTKIYFGHHKEADVGKILKSYGIKTVLFHYGKQSIFETGLYDRIVQSLQANEIAFVELGGVEANPKISLVRIGVELAKKAAVDCILAVGGGSVIDSAKAIACGAVSPLDPWSFSCHQEVPEKALPVGVVLTISAAGSELSNSCVLSNETTKQKIGFNTDLIRPLFSIMNPELTYTVSPFQTGCGIVDILMHTLERYFTTEDDLIFTRDIAEGLMKSVIEAGKRVMIHPQDYNARAALMIASSFSHNGLTGLGTKMYFTVHKLEHELSGMFDHVAHGAGLSVLFPAWALLVYQNNISLFARFARHVMGIANGKPDAETARLGILQLKAFFIEIGMPTTLQQLNIPEEAVEIMADRITEGGIKSVIGFVPLFKQDVMKILEIAK